MVTRTHAFYAACRMKRLCLENLGQTKLWMSAYCFGSAQLKQLGILCVLGISLPVVLSLLALAPVIVVILSIVLATKKLDAKVRSYIAKRQSLLKSGPR